MRSRPRTGIGWRGAARWRRNIRYPCQVPEGRTTAYCYKHPDRETEVSCGRCGKPLCPDCVHHGPTGVRCVECLRLPRRAAGLATHEQILRAVGFALLVAVPGGLLLGWLHWVSLLTAIILGLAIGSAAHVGSRRHRDVSVQIVAALIASASIVIAVAVFAASLPGHLSAQQVVALMSQAGFVVPLLAAVIAAVARFRL